MTFTMRTCVIFISIVASLGITVQGDKGQLYQTAKNVTYFMNQDYAYSWYEAFMECSYRNMTLLSLESDDQFNELYHIMVSQKFAKKPPHLWIGAVGSNRKFVWVSTGKPVISRLWGPGNPDNSANVENCVQIYENTKNLNDIKCTDRFGFVCEVKKVNSGEAVTCVPEKISSDKGPEKYRGLVFNFNQVK